MGKKNQQSAQQPASDKTDAQAPEGEAAGSETLYGSNVQPAMVKIAGFEVQLGEAVQGAFKNSGLTVSEWNALPDEDREARIAAVIDSPDNQQASAEFAEGAAASQPGEGTAAEGSGIAPIATPDAAAAPADESKGPDEQADSAEDQGTLEVVGENPVTSWLKGVFEDYLSVMGEGKQPDAVKGQRAQRSLLDALTRATGGETSHAGVDEAIAEFFAAHQEGATSEANLGRFISAEDAEKLIAFAKG